MADRKIADVIFFGGDIVTVNDAMPEAGGVAVQDGRILAVGSVREIDAYVGPQTRRVDLQGHTLMPGLIEAHTHPIMAAVQHHYFTDLSGFKHRTSKEVYATLRQAIATTPKGQTIKAVGFDPNLVPDLVAPSLADLDALTTDHPLIILSQLGHHAFCNSRAFRMAGVTRDSPDPEHGFYVRDSDGELTGKVCEQWPDIDRLVPRLTQETGLRLLKRQLNEYAEHGFTTVAALGLFPMFKHAMQDIEREVRAPTSPVRIAVYFSEPMMKKRPLDQYVKGVPGEDSYCHIGVKWWADGSPHTGTMATAEPYLDTPFTREAISVQTRPWFGCLNHTSKVLYESMLPYHTRGWQLAVHAHGERAIQQTLDVFEALQSQHPRTDHRYRLEHCGLITDDLLLRAKRLGVTPSLFVDHVHFYGDRLRDDILGPERAARFTPLRSADDLGHRWSLHSDTPCMPVGPFRVIKTAATRFIRPSHDGRVPPGVSLGPEQRVSVESAIKAYTIHAAWQIFHEDHLGSIEVGKLADFVVVDRNPLKVTLDDLDTIKVLETYRHGNKVSLAKGNL